MSTITIIHGTNRVDNRSHQVVRHIYDLLAERGNLATLITPADVLTEVRTERIKDLPIVSEALQTWKDHVVATDTFVLVIPEYNHSFPGEWKLLMDTLFGEYFGKRIFVATVSDGQFGGVRVMEQLLPVLVNFRLSVAPERLHVTNVNDIFSSEGTPSDAGYSERCTKFVDAICK